MAAATVDDVNEAWLSQCRLHPHIEPNAILRVLLEGHASYAVWREEQLARDHRNFMLEEARYKARRAQIEAEHERAKRFNNRWRSRTPPRRPLSGCEATGSVLVEASPEKTEGPRVRARVVDPLEALMD